MARHPNNPTQVRCERRTIPKYKSKSERRVIDPLLPLGARYEPVRLPYPAGTRYYTPDAILPNGIAIEVKGRFLPADRAKLLKVLEAYPDLDLRMVFDNPNRTLNKTSKTTYGMWCDEHAIPYATKRVPQSWVVDAPVNRASQLELMRGLRRKVGK